MSRAPVVFLAHGAPTVALEPGRLGADVAAWAAARPRPRAVAIVSAHWSTPSRIGITSAARHRLIHDFSGFPEALYRIRWPAPGAPDVAARAAAHLEAAGFRAALDPDRGLDHGAWVPLRLAWPEADVPVVQLAMPELPPDGLLRFGAALAPLRDEGVLVAASGGIVHNLGQLRWGAPEDAAEGWAAAFDAWIAERALARDLAALSRWREDAPHAALAAPTSEHLDPLLVALGATAPDDAPESIHEGFTFGTLAMRSLAFSSAGDPSAGQPAARKEPHP